MGGVAAIDVHRHLMPKALLAGLRGRSAPPRVLDAGEVEVVDCGGFVYPLFAGLLDLPGLLASAARDGIATSLLVPPPPGVAGLPRGDAISVARASNDELAALVTAHDGRLAALSVLPLEHPEAAVEEMRRAAALGLAGAQLLSNAGGRPLDEPRFRPLFAAAAELDHPLALHPTVPLDRGVLGEYGLLSTLGFVFDTTVCTVRLVLDGLFERQPDLKLLLPHVGATIPFLLGRIDCESRLFGTAALSAPPSEQLRMLHLDSICESPAALRLALAEYGAERILFGSDEPLWSAESGLRVIDDAGLDPDERDKVLRTNAIHLFKL